MSYAFKFNDDKPFAGNVEAFIESLISIDGVLGHTLRTEFAGLIDGTTKSDRILTALFDSLAPTTEQSTVDGQGAKTAKVTLTESAPGATPRRWFLGRVAIEGFRGINNEGAPLSLKFKPDAINSVSAPNGVGKSSIYDAISYAISGSIPKLDRLMTSENPGTYYVNRFHPSGVGTIELTLCSEDNATEIELKVVRDASGKRTATVTGGLNVNQLIAEINREFVLLDGNTFRSFIEFKALDRGRTFAGLLGLAQYSALRQQLQTLANTKAFNTHFNVAMHAKSRTDLARGRQETLDAIAKDYQEILKEPLPVTESAEASQQKCSEALISVPLLAAMCKEKPFMNIDVAACVTVIKEAEGGVKRDRLAAIIQEQERWASADKPTPTAADCATLVALAQTREKAVAETSGELLHELYLAAEKVLQSDDWSSPSTCPTCEHESGAPILPSVQVKLASFTAVSAATHNLTHEWHEKGWSALAVLEGMVHKEVGKRLVQTRRAIAEKGTLSGAQAADLEVHARALRQLAGKQRDALAAERLALEKELPPSLVTVTTLVEAVRRLQSNWRNLSKHERQLSEETVRAKSVERVKTFLDQAASVFAVADSDIASTRLRKVEPKAQALFKSIMYSDVVPALDKREGREELDIRLAEFWGLKDVSAQALLSESYRNALAVSVYLAAASLYGGGARFIVLDDVTSSFDAGHQHHLVEVIRTQFARPMNAAGPQVILLSHDTLLEKLFNKHSGTVNWSHQRLEGTARTAVLPQSGAVNKVRDATLDLLNAGRVDDAAPRIRQYLEYTLHEVIDRCRIPVPVDLAFGDDKRTAGEYLKAIEAAVALYGKANALVLDSAQVQALTLHSSTIVSNYLSHWSSGQVQAFSAPALLGVMHAIDSFPDCFKHEPTPGAQRRFYRSLSLK